MSINLLTHKWAESKNISSNYYPETTSTNDIAKNEFPKSNETFSLYLTDHQTQGRGRNQNTWQNMSGGEILLSTWSFKTSKSPQPIFTPLLGLALFSTLKKMNNSLALRLKAPNDIMLDDAKLAGLLVEVSQQGCESCIYIGLGLNVLGSPHLDIKTSQLFSHKTFQENIWINFCDDLYDAFKEAVLDGQNSTLSEKNRNDILQALNSNLPQSENYLEVSPQCDLTTPRGVICWDKL